MAADKEQGTNLKLLQESSNSLLADSWDQGTIKTNNGVRLAVLASTPIYRHQTLASLQQNAQDDMSCLHVCLHVRKKERVALRNHSRWSIESTRRYRVHGRCTHLLNTAIAYNHTACRHFRCIKDAKHVWNGACVHMSWFTPFCHPVQSFCE